MSYFKNIVILLIIALFLPACSTMNGANGKNSYQNNAQSIPPLAMPQKLEPDHENYNLYPIPPAGSQQLESTATSRAASLLPH